MRLQVSVVAALVGGACGDNTLPVGEPLSPAAHLTVVAHPDDDLLFMQPDLQDALNGGGGMTSVYVTAGDDNRGLGYVESRYAGLIAAYGAIAGTHDWTCGWIDIAGHAAEHCRLDDARISLVFLGYPDGGLMGEQSMPSIRRQDRVEYDISRAGIDQSEGSRWSRDGSLWEAQAGGARRRGVQSIGAPAHATLPGGRRSRPFLCPRIASCDGRGRAMRTRFDQFGKQMVRDAVEGRCSVETDAEVPADTRRIDLWVTPHEAGASQPDHLGLLGRITSGSVTLEFFHHTLSGEELRMCLIKHGEFRHYLSRRKTLPPLPIQWVISSGRPDAGIDGLGFRPITGGRSGIYESPPLHYTRLVVVSELPVTRDTLLVRLLGAEAGDRGAPGPSGGGTRA